MEKRDVNGTVPDDSLQSLAPVFGHFQGYGDGESGSAITNKDPVLQ